VTRTDESRPRTLLVVGARGIPDVEGGAEKNAEMLFPRVVDAGYRVVLLGIDGLITRDEFGGVELLKAPASRLLGTDKLLYYISAVRTSRRLRPDVVHLQGLGAALFLWGHKTTGAKIVVRYGSADYLVAKWGRVGRAGFLAAEFQTRWADAIIAVAPSLAARLAGRGIVDNVHVIPNAVDELPAAARDGEDRELVEGGPYVLLVGRVTAQKDVLTSIRAFQRVNAASGGRLRLLIAGGLEDESYVEQVRELADPSVVLLGRCTRAQLELLYRECACYVNGSVHEGSSNAALEAIGRGCAVLLSDIPENRDFGLPDRHHFAVGDEAAQARALEAAIAEPHRFVADRTGFSTWDDVAAKTVGVYESVLS